jgi:hypothetical protein
MNSIPIATAITLTSEEHGVLEALVRSTKSEVRMRTRAQVVFAAADGAPTREIGRIVGCTTGTAPKWRVHYTRDRFADLDETGNRDAEPKYGPPEQKRILAMVDQPPPAGYFNWIAPVLAPALGDVHERISGASCAPRRSTCPAASPCARAPTLISSPRRPTLSACTWPRHPFVWTQSEVHLKRLKPCFAVQ